MAILFLFAYWTTLVWEEHAWRTEADYSHGYLILPLSLMLLWIRRENFPGVSVAVDWRALSLIGLAVVMRIAGRLAYMDFLDGWSMLPFIGGAIWLCLGWRAFVWSLPAVLFLAMLVPLPYRFESLLSWKLQGIATQLSTGLLRVFGEPAISDAHTIWIGEEQLMVEEACSGLRTFVGVFALAFFWMATVRRSWLDAVVILLSTIPLALIVNAVRITATGLLFGWFESPQSRLWLHDLTGYLMIPVAALLLWSVKAYWERLYRPLEVHNPSLRIPDPATT